MHDNSSIFRGDGASQNPYALESPPQRAVSDSTDAWPITYVSSTNPTRSVVLPLVFGALSILFGLFMFLLHVLIIDGSPIAMHMSSTAPIIGGVFMVMGAWANHRAVREVRLWPQGIEILRKTSQAIPWESIVDVRVVDSSNPGTIMQKVITLAGTDNEPIDQITGAFPFHKEMLTQIRSIAGIVEADPGKPNAVSASGIKKGRRTAILMAVAALMMISILVVLLPSAYGSYQGTELNLGKSESFWDSPIALLLMGIGVALAAVFFGGMTILSWKGYDLDFTKGKFKIVPLD